MPRKTYSSVLKVYFDLVYENPDKILRYDNTKTLLSIIVDELGIILPLDNLLVCTTTNRIFIDKLTALQARDYVSLFAKSGRSRRSIFVVGYYERSARHTVLNIRRQIKKTNRFCWELIIYAQEYQGRYHLVFNVHLV